MTLSAIPASNRVTLTTSLKVSPPTTASRGSCSSIGARPSIARSIALSACQGRAEWPLTPRNERRALMCPRQPACTCPSVGSRRIASAASWIALEPAKSAGSGLCSGGSSSRPKRSSATSYGPARLGREVSHELDGDGDAALHVAGAQPVHRAVLDTARDVRLSGDGVVVPREHDERDAAPALGEKEERVVVGVHRSELRRYEREQMLSDPAFVGHSRTGCSRARASARRDGRRARSRAERTAA